MSAAAGVDVAVPCGLGVAPCPLEAPMDKTATAPSAQPTDTSRMDRSVIARAMEVPDEASRAWRESHERHCHIKLEWRFGLYCRGLGGSGGAGVISRRSIVF